MCVCVCARVYKLVEVVFFSLYLVRMQPRHSHQNVEFKFRSTKSLIQILWLLLRVNWLAWPMIEANLVPFKKHIWKNISIRHKARTSQIHSLCHHRGPGWIGLEMDSASLCLGCCLGLSYWVNLSNSQICILWIVGLFWRLKTSMWLTRIRQTSHKCPLILYSSYYKQVPEEERTSVAKVWNSLRGKIWCQIWAGGQGGMCVLGGMSMSNLQLFLEELVMAWFLEAEACSVWLVSGVVNWYCMFFSFEFQGLMREAGKFIRRSSLGFCWSCFCLSLDRPVASLVGVQSPQAKDRHHHIDVIYAWAEWMSACPGPPGKHLAIYTHSAYFSNYSFSKVPLFFREGLRMTIS